MLAQLTINLIDRDGIVTVAPVTLELSNSALSVTNVYQP